MAHDPEKTFDGKPRTPEWFAWDYAVEVARDPESHRAAWTLSVRRSVILAASDEIDRLTTELDRAAAERDRLRAENARPQCGCCAAGRLDVRFMPEALDHETEGGTVTVHADRVPFHVCDSCGNAFVTAETLRARHEHVCRAIGAVTPAELKTIRERHGLSQEEFARIATLGVDRLPGWERGREFVTGGAVIEGLVKRVIAAEAERDRLCETLAFVSANLDALRETWGDEGVIRTVADRVRAATAEGGPP